MDWTKYALQAGPDLYESLSKRDAVFGATRFLINKGVRPAEIQSVAGRQIFFVAEGQLDAPAVRTALSKHRPNDPKITKRYFCEDGELFTVDERTYVVTNQWSKESMESVLDALTGRFGGLGLSYRVSSDAEDA